MLPNLRRITRRSERSRFIVSGEQPTVRQRLRSSLVKCGVADASTQLFSREIFLTSLIQYKKSLRKFSNVPRKSLPNDVQSFLDELISHESSSENISKTELKKLIKIYHESPDIGQLLLQKSLYSVENHPESRDLVDSDCFFDVIQSYVIRDQVEKADELLTLCQSSARVQPHPHCFGIVMNGYAKRRTPNALKRIEEILSALEKERLRASAPNKSLLDGPMYNILIDTYIGVFGKQSLDHVRQTIGRMDNIAKRLNDDSLRPSLTSYTSLIKAFILQRPSGFALEVNAALDLLKADPRYSGLTSNERMYLENMAIDAWSKSGDPDAPKRARLIFDAMDAPNTVSYNSLCNIHASIGDIDQVCRLYEKMQTDFEFGRNKSCRPDERTYAIVMHALQKSNRLYVTEKAEQIFKAILLPDTVTYNTLLNMYAQKGNAEKALRLVHQMESDFQSGKNKDCRPSMQTYNTILNALQNSNHLDAIENAEQIFRAISLPNTVTYNTLLNMYAQKGDVEKAMNLLHQMQSEFQSGKNKDSRPNMRTYSIILNALQKSNLPDAAEKAEQLFKFIPLPNTIAYSTLINIFAQKGDIEKALRLVRQMQTDFESGKNKDCRPDMQTYSIILNALQNSNRSDAAEKAEQLFNAIHMPDTVTYSALLNIYVQQSDFEKALNLVHKMQTDFQSGKNRNCRPSIHTYNIILNLLRKPSFPNATEKAEQIFDAIPLPNTVTYGTLLNMYAKNGNAEKALNLVHQMQSDFQSGKNMDCCPDMRTYNTMLNVLHKSNLSDAVEKAEQIFNAIPFPDAYTYSTLLNIYAERKMSKEAISLARRMQSDFVSGKNRFCKPTDVSKRTLLMALRIAYDPVLKKEARDVIKWFREQHIKR
jgi:pentatricopeptide repeat protein